jgi:hypothetical protein
MEIEASDLCTGLLTAVLGLIGLLLASGAHDNEMYVFGLSLAGFATVFVFGLMRRHYDRADAARAAVRVPGHE